MKGRSRDIRQPIPVARAISWRPLHGVDHVLDPVEAPGVDFPVAGGLGLDGLKRVVQHAAGLGNLAALAITAVNPEKDTDERTVIAALAVIEAALGRNM